MSLLHQKQNSSWLLWKMSKDEEMKNNWPVLSSAAHRTYFTKQNFLIPILLLEGQKDLCRSLKGGVGLRI